MFFERYEGAQAALTYECRPKPRFSIEGVTGLDVFFKSGSSMQRFQEASLKT